MSGAIPSLSLYVFIMFVCQLYLFYCRNTFCAGFTNVYVTIGIFVESRSLI